MKKLLTILFLVVACVAKAQYIPNSSAQSWKGVFGRESLQFPQGCGDPVTRVNAPDSSQTAFYWDSCADVLYMFSPKLQQWLTIQGGGSICNGVLQPGYVTWSGDGLTFDVTAGLFTIDCITYAGNAGSITLDPADATFPRFDVIGWDTTGAVIKVTGTAGMNPAIPQVDPDYQIGLTVISIPAGATVPGGITQDVIYDENSEGWTGAATGITVDLDDTDNPYHLTKSADAGAWAPTPKTLTFTNDTGTVDANDYGILKLFINLKDTIAGIGNIRVSFLNGSTVVSNIVSLGSGVGFNRSTINSYQNVSVPLSSFIFTNTLFDKVRITFAGTGSGAYIDYIQLQGGITPPTVAGVYQDTTYYRNDTLFGRKNNREFEIGKLGLAKLIQQQFIVIYNPDSTYDPYGADVAIGVDTSGLASWIVNNVIDNDTTIANIIEDVDYVVDTISNSPPVGAVNGDKVLVGTSPTGAFVGHANEVAELVGGVWQFTVPEAGESLEVRNSTQLLFYKFDGTNWNLISVPALIGGNSGLTAPDIGTRDSNSFTIKTKNIPAIVIDENQNVKLPEFANLEDSNVYYRPTVDGKIDTAYFSELIAGSGITITPGPNRTDTISSTGGGGGLRFAYPTEDYVAFENRNFNLNNYFFTIKNSISGETDLMTLSKSLIELNSYDHNANVGLSKLTLKNSEDEISFSLMGYENDIGTTVRIYGHPINDSIDYSAGVHVFRGNTIFTGNGTPGVGKVPTGTDADGHWTWQASGGGGSVTVVAGGKSDIDSNLVYNGGSFKKASPLGYINIMDYGGINDSTGDNSTAIAAAIDALPARGGVIYFPPGIYRVITQIDVDKAVTFQGAGCGSYPDEEWVPSATKIVTPSSTLKLFYTTVKNVKFYDLTIQNTATTPTEGAGIYGYVGTGMIVDKCMVTGFWNNIQMVNAGEWTVSNSYITGMVNAGIVVRDSITPDDGDEAIVNCIIAARIRNANFGVLWLSGGGLRLLNNKFNWGYEGVRMGWPVYCVFTDGQTGNGHFSNNSFENYTENAIFVDPQGTDFVGNLVITGNQFQNLYAPSVKADIKLMTTMIGVSIVGNVFSTSTGADTAIYFDFNIFKINCSNSYQGYDIPVIYGTNSFNSGFDNNTIATSTQMGVAAYSPTATPLNLSMGGTLYNSNTPVNTGLKIRLYNDGTNANTSGFGVTGNSEFNMFSWAASGWGNIQYVNNGTQAMRTFSSGGITVGPGTTEVTSAALNIESTTKGLLLPRMTKAQRDAISSPVAGLAVYQTDNTPGLRVYNGTNWMRYTETAD